MMTISPRKAALYAVSGVAAISLATLIPSTAFYLLFQREVLSHGTRGGMGAVLWARTLPEGSSSGAAPSGASSTGRDWERVLHRGVSLPLPPGNVRRIEAEGERLVVEFEKGTLTAARLPAGSIRGLLLAEHREVGGAEEAVAGFDDALALRAAATATPSDFRMGMNAGERNLYAASLLTKMLLWDAPPEAEGAEMLTFGSAPGGPSGALLRLQEGPSRAIVSAPQGVFVFAMTGPFPREWIGEPARWAAIAPAD